MSSSKYISTRGNVSGLNFKDAVMMGLADDGGLLLPAEIPHIDSDTLKRWKALSYPELAYEVMSPFIGDAVPADDLKVLVNRSYSTFTAKEVVPVRRVGDVFITELFHGPTLAFKDIALQFLGNMFEYILKQTGGKLNILGATSGDTGSAAIHGV
ncbi:MAG: hypothetical protein J6X55_11620, partial [Victivallales bacterium]|nr:hypothetical protein [Victivallales bacterium]